MPKRIGITMRVDTIHYPSGTCETRDALSQEWVQAIEHVLPNSILIPLQNKSKNILNTVKDLEIEAFIFSGGNDIDDHLLRKENELILLDYAYKNCLPCVGVCRGMQMMNIHQGGTISKITEHVAKNHDIFFEETAETSCVNSFHNFGIFEEDKASSFDIIAYSVDNCHKKSIEAFRHKTLPWLGMMWHFEREKEITPIEENLIIQVFGA